MNLRFKNNKSQSALEFLTTYGWAFLILLVMISALAYFGILNPSKILPNSCTLGSEFYCMDYTLQSASPGTLRLKLKSNAASLINVSNISLTSNSVTPFACSGGGTGTGILPNSTIPFDITWTNCNLAAAGFTSGNKVKILMKLRYFEVTSGPSYSKEVNGEIFTTVI